MRSVDPSSDRARQLEQLQAVLADAPGGTLELTIGTRSIELGPWVHHQLQLWAGREATEVGRLLAELVSRRMVILSHLHQLDVVSFEGGAASEAARAELGAVLDDGRRCVIDAQRAAKNLFAASRHHDSQQLQGQAEGLRAELDRLANVLVDGDQVTPGTAAAAPPPATPAARADAKGRRRIQALLAVLLVLAAARGVMFLVAHRHDLPMLDRAAFADLELVEEVVARPPSLYLTLGDGWDDLDPEQRRSLVAAVGERLRAAGYSGALLRDPGGATRARWLRRTGVELID